MKTHAVAPSLQQRINPIGALLIAAQMRAAEESDITGIYITWIPKPTCDLRSSVVADELKTGLGQCSRVSSTPISQLISVSATWHP